MRKVLARAAADLAVILTAMLIVVLMGWMLPAQSQTLQTSAVSGAYYTFPAIASVTTSPSIAVNNVIPTKHGMQVNTTGAPAACTYSLEGSLDNTNWTAIISAQVCTTSGVLTWEATGTKPVLFVRVNFTALSGGATATATYVGSK